MVKLRRGRLTNPDTNFSSPATISFVRAMTLSQIGERLKKPGFSTEHLLETLEEAVTQLAKVDQSTSDKILTSLTTSMDALIMPNILRHHDNDVRILVANCFSEIIRITAPKVIYTEDILKEIFELIVTTFRGLDEIHSPSFARRVIILETVEKFELFNLMLDLQCDDLILDVFKIFFSKAREDHSENILISMQNIMTGILNKCGYISEDLLSVLLKSLSRAIKNNSPADVRLAMNVMKRVANKVQPNVNLFLTSAMSSESKFENDLYETIFNIYQCAPQILQSIIPNLTQKLLSELSDVRLSTVKLLGRIFALPGRALADDFQPLLSEFLKRFTDNSVEVRLATVTYAKDCILSNPFRPETSGITAALSERLLDSNEDIQKQVIGAICEIAKYALKSIPTDAIRKVADCFHDQTVSIQKYTLGRLLKVYRVYCSKCLDGSVGNIELDWIPGKILGWCHDKDYRSQVVDIVFSISLFPSDLPVSERVKHWIAMFSEFKKPDFKVFEEVLNQKKRLQVEMQNFLSWREKLKEEDTPELQCKILSCTDIMSEYINDIPKVKESFTKLCEIKDDHIWKALSSLLDSSLTFVQSQTTFDYLLEQLGDMHPQYEFMKILSIRCSYLLFGKEHVKEMLKEIAENTLAGKDKIVQSSMNLLVLFARFFPSLFDGAVEDMIHLLKDDNDHVKEGAVHILSKIGGAIQEKMIETNCPVDLLLEKLCLEGTRKQAKYAVQAIVAIKKDFGLETLSALYKRLVDMLESAEHLATVLQSLGCIAQTAMSVFETRENDIIKFICRKLLRRNSIPTDISGAGSNDQSKECFLKICGIKTLVRSFLPDRDPHLRENIRALFAVIKQLITIGEISEDVQSSKVDQSHIRLAAAKAVMRLSRQWDSHIGPDLLQLALRIAQGNPHEELSNTSPDKNAPKDGKGLESENMIIEVVPNEVNFAADNVLVTAAEASVIPKDGECLEFERPSEQHEEQSKSRSEAVPNEVKSTADNGMITVAEASVLPIKKRGRPYKDGPKDGKSLQLENPSEQNKKRSNNRIKEVIPNEVKNGPIDGKSLELKKPSEKHEEQSKSRSEAVRNEVKFTADNSMMTVAEASVLPRGKLGRPYKSGPKHGASLLLENPSEQHKKRSKTRIKEVIANEVKNGPINGKCLELKKPSEQHEEPLQSTREVALNEVNIATDNITTTVAEASILPRGKRGRPYKNGPKDGATLQLENPSEQHKKRSKTRIKEVIANEVKNGPINGKCLELKEPSEQHEEPLLSTREVALNEVNIATDNITTTVAEASVLPRGKRGRPYKKAPKDGANLQSENPSEQHKKRSKTRIKEVIANEVKNSPIDGKCLELKKASEQHEEPLQSTRKVALNEVNIATDNITTTVAEASVLPRGKRGRPYKNGPKDSAILQLENPSEQHKKRSKTRIKEVIANEVKNGPIDRKCLELKKPSEQHEEPLQSTREVALNEVNIATDNITTTVAEASVLPRGKRGRPYKNGPKDSAILQLENPSEQHKKRSKTRIKEVIANEVKNGPIDRKCLEFKKPSEQHEEPLQSTREVALNEVNIATDNITTTVAEASVLPRGKRGRPYKNAPKHGANLQSENPSEQHKKRSKTRIKEVIANEVKNSPIDGKCLELKKASEQHEKSLQSTREVALNEVNIATDNITTTVAEASVLPRGKRGRPYKNGPKDSATLQLENPSEQHKKRSKTRIKEVIANEVKNGRIDGKCLELKKPSEQHEEPLQSTREVALNKVNIATDNIATTVAEAPVLPKSRKSDIQSACKDEREKKGKSVDAVPGKTRVADVETMESSKRKKRRLCKESPDVLSLGQQLQGLIEKFKGLKLSECRGSRSKGPRKRSVSKEKLIEERVSEKFLGAELTPNCQPLQKPAKRPVHPEKELNEDGNNHKEAPRMLRSNSLSGVEKSASQKFKKEVGGELIGKSIKVWWPDDKKFYAGVVESYNSKFKKHKVNYDDGDVEVLTLGKERWELIDRNPMPTKEVTTSVISAKSKGVTSFSNTGLQTVNPNALDAWKLALSNTGLQSVYPNALDVCKPSLSNTGLQSVNPNALDVCKPSLSNTGLQSVNPNALDAWKSSLSNTGLQSVNPNIYDAWKLRYNACSSECKNDSAERTSFAGGYGRVTSLSNTELQSVNPNNYDAWKLRYNACSSESKKDSAERTSFAGGYGRVTSLSNTGLQSVNPNVHDDPNFHDVWKPRYNACSSKSKKDSAEKTADPLVFTDANEPLCSKGHQQDIPQSEKDSAERTADSLVFASTDANEPFCSKGHQQDIPQSEKDSAERTADSIVFTDANEPLCSKGHQQHIPESKKDSAERIAISIVFTDANEPLCSKGHQRDISEREKDSAERTANSLVFTDANEPLCFKGHQQHIPEGEKDSAEMNADSLVFTDANEPLCSKGHQQHIPETALCSKGHQQDIPIIDLTGHQQDIPIIDLTDL